MNSMSRRTSLTLSACAATLLLAACGGGGSDAPAPAPIASPPPAALSCSFEDQKRWLRDYMQTSYLWYRSSSNPAPEPFSSYASYFDALLWQGTDRYSFTITEAEYQASFVQGKVFGYGAAFVQEGGAGGPIRITYVEPNSPASQQGLLRGDTVVRINGTVLAQPLDAVGVNLVNQILFPASTGTNAFLGVRASGTGPERSVSMSSQDVVSSPVLRADVITTPDGRRVGYIVFNSFVQTATGQLRSVFTQFKQQGVSDLVLDLRYNGGGLIDIANELSAMVVGNRVQGQPFITYRHNDKLAPSFDRVFNFLGVSESTALNLNRVYVLTTGRTASSSELIVNSLRPYAEVVQIGKTTFGKPVGQYPTTNCGQTAIAVNFETVNALNQGQYYAGIAPRCDVPDDLGFQLGDLNEPMLRSALNYRQTGTCVSTGLQKSRVELKHLGRRDTFGAMIGSR